MHIPLWVCCTLWIMAPCTIRTLQVQPHNAPASPCREGEKRFHKGCVSIDQNIKCDQCNLIRYTLHCVKWGQEPWCSFCGTGMNMYGSTMWQRKCHQSRKNIMATPFLIETASHNTRYSKQISYITLLDEFLPVYTTRLSVRADTSEGCPLWSHL